MGAALRGGVLARLDAADRGAGVRRSRSGVPRLGGYRGKAPGHDRRASHRDGVDQPILARAQSHRYAESGRAARAAARSLAQGSSAAALRGLLALSPSKLASSPLILVTERGPSGVRQKTLGSLPAFAGTKGRGNDDIKDLGVTPFVTLKNAAQRAPAYSGIS